MTGKRQIETRSKKVVRGMAQRSLDLIEAMATITEAAQPITGRGVGYKLFTSGLIPSMETAEMQRVYRLLKEARERGMIEWDWIVDEAREFERVATWDDPEEYAKATIQDYRRDAWKQQPRRIECWSEKGTVRGVLAPVLDHYGVGFRVMHGFSSATVVHDIAQDNDRRRLIALYVGDYDPSGMFMSQVDLPERLRKYGGYHVIVHRIALTKSQLRRLPSFAAADKRRDPRFKWFTKNFGRQCWEIDALDPNVLRNCVERYIKMQIEPEAWRRCEAVNEAERESLVHVMSQWARRATAG
jgi:hypothetical protein